MYLTFQAGTRRLALPLARAREVLGGGAVIPIPGCRPGFLGVLVREGVAVPVIDLPLLEGEAPSGPRAREVVVVDAKESRLAIVAAESASAPLDQDAPASEPGEAAWSFLLGAVTIGGERAWLFDPDRLARAIGASPGGEEEP